ncbi:hemolysin III family protein [bacterium]|nr:hemolysin III family protein [bacterium]MBU1073229.1 hemolysin III family protein [bacterium]MBU1676820.1 hemolysin III family protein [bacterium]
MRSDKRSFTVGEEIAHSVTHGLGAALSVVGLVLLVVRAVASGDPWRMVSFAIYGATLVLLYTASTLYHALTPRRAKSVFQVLDHAFIYVLIAGTNTPFLLVSLRGPWGWSLFGVVWGLTVVGVLFKVRFAGKFRLLSTLLYIGLGWVCIIAIKPMLANVPSAGLAWLLAGGVAYTGGTVFYLWRGMRYHHAVWHLFVLTGSICHFVAIYGHLG